MEAYISFNSRQVLAMLKRHLAQIGAPECTEIHIEVDYSHTGNINDFRIKFKLPHPHETTQGQRINERKNPVCVHSNAGSDPASKI